MRTEFLPIYVIGLIFFALLNSCETKPDFIGSDLLPSGDNFTVSFDSTEIVHAYSVLGDSLIGSNKEIQLLGSIIDPFFGFSKAEYVTQIEASSSSQSFGLNPVVDSVILYLQYNEISGEGIFPQQIRAYEYLEYLRKDTNYYTNKDITGLYRQPEIGTGWLSFNDTVAKIYITDDEFINKFLQAEDSILKNTDYVQELMYGIYLTSDDVTTEGFIASLPHDASGTLLRFYYANDTLDSLYQDYDISRVASQQFNLFKHDYTGYPIEGYLSDTSRNNSLMFLQSMSGVYSIIRFPGFTSWLDSMPVAINEAKLILPVADTNLTRQQSKYFPERLVMYLIEPDGKYNFVYDFLVSPESFGGDYEEISNSYNFTIKVQLQSLAHGDVGNLDMMIRPSNGDETVRRGIFYGWSEDFMKRMRLEITYTIL